MGSWLVYGLGTENQNLPGFVVVSPAAVFQGAQLWASSFLPSAYQGTLIRELEKPEGTGCWLPGREEGQAIRHL